MILGLGSVTFYSLICTLLVYFWPLWSLGYTFFNNILTSNVHWTKSTMDQQRWSQWVYTCIIAQVYCYDVFFDYHQGVLSQKTEGIELIQHNLTFTAFNSRPSLYLARVEQNSCWAWCGLLMGAAILVSFETRNLIGLELISAFLDQSEVRSHKASLFTGGRARSVVTPVKLSIWLSFIFKLGRKISCI